MCTSLKMFLLGLRFFNMYKISAEQEEINYDPNILPENIIKFHEKVVDYSRKVLGESSAFVAEQLDRLGNIHLSQNRVDEAMYYFE